MSIHLAPIFNVYLVGVDYKFPRECNNKLGKNIDQKPDHVPSIKEIKDILELAKENVLNDIKILGMEVNEEFCENVSIPVTSCSINAVLIDDPMNDDDDDEQQLLDDDPSIENIPCNVLQEIEDDAKLISENLEIDLDLRDYDNNRKTKNKLGRNSLYLRVILKSKKTVTVRKSSLCWLYSEKYGRLSSDRIFKFRGTSSSRISARLDKRKELVRKNKKKLSNAFSSSSSDLSD